MKKRLISLISILALSAGLLAGCGNAAKEEEAAASAVSESTEAESTPEATKAPESEPVSETHEIVGTLEDITMNAITLRILDGRVLTFNANNVDHTFSYGINQGNWVTVVYKGDLEGTDTSNLTILQIHDEDTDYVREVKAQSTI